MEYQSIGQVSKTHGISARMLRYYEQIGLLESLRKEDNDYRAYDEAAVKRIQQIVLLRKLQIPVKKIRVILGNPETAAVIDIFKENIAGLEQEISALTTIKTILEGFVAEIEKLTAVRLSLDLLSENSMQSLAESLSLVQKNVKETFNMSDLDRAAQVLGKLRDVRVVYLPPMTEAAIRRKGKYAQEKAWKALNAFVEKHKLLEIKPDLRVFRFEYVNGVGKDCGGAEIWVTIPDDFKVAAPFVRKQFLGGHYAAHAIGENIYETTLGLQDWVNESNEYRHDLSLDRCEPPIKEIDSFGGMRHDLEEVLNYYKYHNPRCENQTDLLMPVKPYAPTEEVPAELPGSKEKCGFKASFVTKNKFRIIGFSHLMNSDTSSTDAFEEELKADGRLELLNKYRKPGALILCFGSIDLDSQLQGGWRYTVCLAEPDITDARALMEHEPYVGAIDASNWLIFEYTGDRDFDDHAAGSKLGYTWNGCISGTFSKAAPEGKIGKPDPGATYYSWYPVK